MSERSSDADLVGRARAGEVEAFAELYRRYFDSIFRYLRLRTERDEDAEDLAETVFLSAYQSLGRYREQGWPFSAFLYRVARNALTDHYRRRRPETGLEKAESLATAARSLDEDLEMSERVRLVQNEMTGLPADYQEVIRLRILLGLPTEMAAQWMGRSEGAVRILLYRALTALRRKLNEADDGVDRDG